MFTTLFTLPRYDMLMLKIPSSVCFCYAVLACIGKSASLHVILSDLFPSLWGGRERFLVSLSGVRGEKGEEREGREVAWGIWDIYSLQLSVVIDSVTLRTKIILASVCSAHDSSALSWEETNNNNKRGICFLSSYTYTYLFPPQPLWLISTKHPWNRYSSSNT